MQLRQVRPGFIQVPAHSVRRTPEQYKVIPKELNQSQPESGVEQHTPATGLSAADLEQQHNIRSQPLKTDTARPMQDSVIG